MRRALLLSLLLVTAPASLRSSPGFALAAVADAASVKLLACVPALEAQARSATFEARVQRARGSERMQVRFTLQRRDELLGGWRRVAAPGLDEWHTSDPGVSRYSYSKTVQNLTAPASYRTVVRFRWLDGGAVLARSRETSRTCRQPDLRPDLVAERIDVVDGGYAVALRNAGRSAAAAFAVTLSAGAEQLAPQDVAALEPGERRVVTFAGPACEAGAPLLATVDADAAVAERDEDDNVLAAPCPGPAARSTRESAP